jgi:hypothetical protein
MTLSRLQGCDPSAMRRWSCRRSTSAGTPLLNRHDTEAAENKTKRKQTNGSANKQTAAQNGDRSFKAKPPARLQLAAEEALEVTVL